MDKLKVLSIIRSTEFATILSIFGYMLFIICFGWIEALALFLIIWGNNIHQSLSEEKLHNVNYDLEQLIKEDK